MLRIASKPLWASAIFSFVVFAVVTALTIRSYFVSDLFICLRAQWSMSIETSDGEFWLGHTLVVDPRYSIPHVGFVHSTVKLDGNGVFPDRFPGTWLHFRRFGFALVTGERWNDYHHGLFMPGWFLICGFGILPARLLIRSLRHRRSGLAGHCGVCGYDLRASFERCPECGTTIIPVGDC